MKIALLTDGIYPYVVGGMQKHSYYLTKYLAQQEVYVDLYHTGTFEANTVNLTGFTEEELKFITSIYIPFPSLGSFPGHYLLESFKYSVIIYRELIKRKTVDLIYCQGLTGWRTIQQKDIGVKLPITFVNLHGLNMYQFNASFKAKSEARLLRIATDSILKKSDFVISLGGKLTRLLEEAGVEKAKIIEQPIGIESEWVTGSIDTCSSFQKPRKLVFIGRYDKVKGIELLHTVLADLQGADFEFTFIGPIPPGKQIKHSNVHYLGLLKDEQEIKQILRAADVLVCPSYSEGMPTVILEAMASGLAIIATDVGAVNTMVSIENGWLIPVADKAALKQAIVEAIHIDQRELYQKKEASLHLVKERFTWCTVIQTTIDRITKIVN